MSMVHIKGMSRFLATLADLPQIFLRILSSNVELSLHFLNENLIFLKYKAQ